MTKPVSAAQRLANSVWLRDQIDKLARDAESNAKEDAARAKEDSPDARDRHEARSDTAKHYASELRRILRGLTWEEDFAKRAGAAWNRAVGEVAKTRQKRRRVAPLRKPSATSRIVGYRYEGTIVDLPRVEAILRRAEASNIVTQYVAKQYGRSDENVDCVWFNGPPGRDLRKVRDEVRSLVQVRS